MGSKTDQIKGYANEAVGKVKQGVGKAIGNDRLRAKGAAQEAKGDAQKAVGKAKGAIKDVADKAQKNCDNQRLMLFAKGSAQQGRPSIPDLQRNSPPLAPE